MVRGRYFNFFFEASMASMVFLLLMFVGCQATIMNKGGIPYQISNPQGPGVYSTDFETNVKGSVEHFDVYGEVQTKYSQVYWTRNAPIPLPTDLIKRFNNKVMAITGYEIDQVTYTGPKPTIIKSSDGSLSGFSCYPSCKGTDKSVPIYNAYNHHYFGWLMGKDSELFDLPHDEATYTPNPSRTGIRDLPHNYKFPTNIVFKENPGGEYRKSYHGYPSGYAQLLHSPSQCVIEPMQIDTHNRNYDLTNETGHMPWFLPKILENKMTNLHNELSPLIECPCSDRIKKRIVNSSTILTKGKCDLPITSQTECTAAIKNLVTVSSSTTVSNTSLPTGCIAVPDKKSQSYSAIFNKAKSNQDCTVGTTSFTWNGPLNDTRVDCSGECLPSDPKYGCTGEFKSQCTWDSPETAQKMCGMYPTCEAIYCSTAYSARLLCFGRKTTNSRKGTSTTDQVWKKVYTNAQKLHGHVALGDIDLMISHDGKNANLTMSGPDGVWFGVGFDAVAMKDLPYAIIVNGNGEVTERKLVDHGPGALLKSSIKILSSNVVAGIRTVVLARPIKGTTKDYFTIPSIPENVNMISAVGSTPELAYHKTRTGGMIALLPTDTRSCICKPKRTEYINYMNESNEVFHINCVDEPRSDMLRHGDGTGRNVSNSACHVDTYHGGLRCCKNSWFLTDVEQDSLIGDIVDTYYLKWRFYFQEYIPASATQPASHQHLHHWVFLIDDSVNDYEEDNANYGTKSIGKITAHLTGGGMGLEDRPKSFSEMTFFVMTPHCHAPNCIREELWNADTGEIICNVSANLGSAKYGSTKKVFNEADYIAIPPCIFGNQPGLQKPVKILPNTKITAIKYFNNTFRHLGQMAQWTGLMKYNTDPY